MAQKQKAINTFEKGLHMDSPPENQPKGTYSYALNSVIETEGGTLNYFTNEESNKLSLQLNKDILAHIYINNNELVFLSINENNLSEIGIYDLKNESYETHVVCDLGFSKEYLIDITYRLRRGCERVIYFTDNNNKPMIYNFDKPQNFKNELGEFDKDKFYLQKSGSKIPKFRSIEVIDELGTLKSGSYFIGIQYLDEDLNATEVISVSNKINIYKDKITDSYYTIGGSIGTDNMLYSKQQTSKSIKINLYNLDTDFPFYRLAIISYTAGDGVTPEVVFTDRISTRVTSYTFDGKAYSLGTLQEIQQESFIIDRAKNITQLDNKLLLSNLTGKITDYCSLQKYASKIKSNVVIKEKLLTQMHTGSDKYPAVDLFSIGYMPGEIYSFGIVYYFSDGTKSPVYHIPGLPNNGNDVFNDGIRYSMSKNNTLESIFYDRRDTCTDYWGTDAYGNRLQDTLVRHHRFPTRTELGLELLYEKGEQEAIKDTIKENLLLVTVPYTYNVPVGSTPQTPSVTVKVFYSTDENEVKELSFTFNTLPGINEYEKTLDLGLYQNVSVIKIDTESSDSNVSLSQALYSLSSEHNYNNKVPNKYTKILGIEFSNIEKPDVSHLGIEVIGYEIVRQERTENNKTVLDTGVLTPVLDTEKFSNNYHIFPNLTNNLFSNLEIIFLNAFTDNGKNYPKLNKLLKGLISPELLFNHREFTTAKIRHLGYFNQVQRTLIRDTTQDVQSGTSYDAEANKRKERDTDGYDLMTLSRINKISYSNLSQPQELNVKKIFYLDAISSFNDTEENSKEIFNISCDNKTGIVTLDGESTNKEFYDLKKLPYVLLYRNISNPYDNFLSARFYKQQLNISEFRNDKESIRIYGGDSYISPLKYLTSTFVDNKIRQRAKKSGVFKIILGALTIVAAIATAVLLPGVGIGLSAAAMSTLTAAVASTAITFGFSMISSGIKQENIRRVYTDLWDKGLKYSVRDNDVLKELVIPNPPDDSIQWFFEVIEDLWFETNFNIPLRIDIDNYGIAYLPSLKPVTDESVNKYVLNKITVVDTDRNSGRLYKGFATSETYQLNKDYMVNNQTKFHYPLPYEYDCCSTCREVFPHRIVYSENAFSEELTDNFRKFLPNNYKDISGETGPINNMFVQSNRLYLHTSESLWLQPSSYQERITNEIVSFVGTGSLLESPVQKIVDDETGNSVGLRHKWGALLSKHGYFFFSSGQSKIYNFTGKLDDLSNKGISSFLKYSITDIPDNPLYNKGYIVGYDPKKERILFTKVDGEDSWTLSYSLKTTSFRSFHSYIPNRYITTPNEIYSWNTGLKSLWKHNIIGHYQNFYGENHPHILQYTSQVSPIMVRNTTELGLNTLVSKYDLQKNSFVNIDNISYSKILVYNSKQCLGEKELVYRNETSTNFFSQSLKSHNKNNINIRRADKNWYINNLRDFVIDYTQPLFINSKNLIGLNQDINESIIDVNKNWTDLQLFKDKYLCVRYTFNNFENYKITTNFTTEDYEQSLR